MNKKLFVKKPTGIIALLIILVICTLSLNISTFADDDSDEMTLMTIDFSDYLETVDTSNMTDAEALVAIALANNGFYAQDFMPDYVEGWCADFVFSCAKAAGISSRVISYTGHPPTMYTNVRNAGGALVAYAQPGDLVFYFDGDFCRHVGIAINGSQAINGNWGGGDNSESYVAIAPIEYYHWMEIGEDYLIVRPNYADGSGDPTGDLFGDYPCWREIDGYMHYMISPNDDAVGWMRIEGEWYFFNSSGIMQTGWKKIDNFWYYFNTDGIMLTEWQEIDGDRYFLGFEGEMQTGWQQIKGSWYFFKPSGEMQTGWFKSGNTWYYLNSSGVMLTGLQQIGSTWYYFNPSGAMATGWQMVDGSWYYFNPSGAMATGWIKINGTWYYFKPSGVMASNEWVSGYWWLSSSGAWTYTYKGSWQTDDNGTRFGDTAGRFEKDVTIIIDDVAYSFDANGYLITDEESDTLTNISE